MRVSDIVAGVISVGACLTITVRDLPEVPIQAAAWSTISETMSVSTMTGTTHIDPELVENDLEYGKCGIRWKRKEVIFRDGFERREK